MLDSVVLEVFSRIPYWSLQYLETMFPRYERYGDNWIETGDNFGYRDDALHSSSVPSHPFRVIQRGFELFMNERSKLRLERIEERIPNLGYGLVAGTDPGQGKVKLSDLLHYEVEGSEVSLGIRSSDYDVVGVGSSELAAAFDFYRLAALHWYEETMPSISDIFFDFGDEPFEDLDGNSCLSLTNWEQIMSSSLRNYLDSEALEFFDKFYDHRDYSLQISKTLTRVGRIELLEGDFDLYLNPQRNHLKADHPDDCEKSRSMSNFFEKTLVIDSRINIISPPLSYSKMVDHFDVDNFRGSRVFYMKAFETSEEDC